ncbi:Conjugal transfer protein trbL [Cupriavidus taiwanensis]|uniref:Conjugal transfer protein trbL n=1 Tax=Cupriavidus taiwanensis TaxID=164546 RepID=A0A375EDQ3_9BURK|nr:type IV secretion system protein [Cupriavidus taiwanensis]SOZ72724.1 Conjugal transfer protein trbL [Cupriavidus taiwanensis]SOZ73421.1 Conjugal transfer protein trbL [Cupriavidus taiwanensis]SOZ75116.1 Conjugal transfer protein trbL [Cupriavidus taiwanensis]SPA03819.1 Conjugal transfer protein trbL [Cupriavidus taiwanensis]SPA11681.1 Conjugal transfer protein trbL [Cupriavidus taiwanensis]
MIGMLTMGVWVRLRFVALLLAALCLLPQPGNAQEATGGNPPVAAATAGKPGDIATGIMKTLNRLDRMRSSLIQAAASLSQTTVEDANKIAFGLGVITLVLAGLRFAATSDPVSAWTDLFETILVLGIFSALFASYTSFSAGLFLWFAHLADSINGGVSVYNLPASLANTGGKFVDSIVTNLKAGLINPLSLVDALVAAILFAFAFIAVLIAALIYSWFILVGHLLVAIGIVVGPLAVAFGMADISRRFFNAWLDYMVTGSMYMVVAAIISQLVSKSLISMVSDVGKVGTDTTIAASYALSTAIILVFVAMEIPKIAGSLFGTGGGVGATGGMKMLGRGAWNLGNKLAGR